MGDLETLGRFTPLVSHVHVLGRGSLFQSALGATSSDVGNEVVRVQVEGVTEVTKGENREPMTSPLTDPGVGFMSVDCLACFVGIQNCLSLYKSVLVK